VGVVKLTSCDGCQLTILDLEEASPGFALHVTLRDACTTHVQTVTTAA